MKSGKFLCLIVGFCMIVCAGCGSGNVPMKGKVVFSDDATPLTVGMVAFTNASFTARGQIQPDGTFTISSTGKNDGLPPGDYAITITGAAVSAKEASEETPMIPLIEEKYALSTTTDLKLSVDSSTRSYEIKVDRYSGAKNGK